MADETPVEALENAPADYNTTPQEDQVPGDAAGAKSADHKDHNHPETTVCPQSEVVDDALVIEVEKDIDAEGISRSEELLADSDRTELPGAVSDPGDPHPLPSRGAQLTDEEIEASGQPIEVIEEAAQQPQEDQRGQTLEAPPAEDYTDGLKAGSPDPELVAQLEQTRVDTYGEDSPAEPESSPETNPGQDPGVVEDEERVAE